MRNINVYSLFVLILFNPLSFSSAQTEKEIKISVDPRIELLTVIQLLSDYKVLTKLDSKYKQDVLEYFEKYDELEAVSLFEDLDDDGFNYDRPVGLMLKLSNPPELDTLFHVSDYYYARYGGRENIDKFITSLRKFYIETDFEKFLKQQEGFYRSIEQSVKDTCRKITIGALEQYYGAEQKGYNIVLSPLLHGGGYGGSTIDKDGAVEIYSIIGPYDTVDSSVVFGSSERFFELVWHEFGHSFIGSIVEKYSDAVDSVKNLFDPIESKMKKKAYSNWMTCFSEHLIRAVVIRMLELNIDKNYAIQTRAEELGKGFIYIDRFLNSLMIYEQN